ncbi:hypothetical protein [Streptomyces sp. NPDC005283]|uniref:hypothetical protein n=1 Tax=Streptomyces sp. NPDC005283 TaxID=3156871 RepID=UPI003455F372
MQVHQVRPQPQADPVRAQDRHLPHARGPEGGARCTLLLVQAPTGGAGQGPQAVALSHRVKDVVPEQPVTAADGGMDHDTSRHRMMGGQHGPGDTQVVLAVDGHRERRTTRGAQRLAGRAAPGDSEAAHQDVHGDLTERVDRIQQTHVLPPPAVTGHRSR